MKLGYKIQKDRYKYSKQETQTQLYFTRVQPFNGPRDEELITVESWVPSNLRRRWKHKYTWVSMYGSTLKITNHLMVWQNNTVKKLLSHRFWCGRCGKGTMSKFKKEYLLLSTYLSRDYRLKEWKNKKHKY
jgi:hypothetical protein